MFAAERGPEREAGLVERQARGFLSAIDCKGRGGDTAVVGGGSQEIVTML